MAVSKFAKFLLNPFLVMMMFVRAEREDEWLYT